MHSDARSLNSILSVSGAPANAALSIPLMLLSCISGFLFVLFTAQTAQAQTFTVLYNFTGQSDGGGPEAGVTIDRAGNLYGTTRQGAFTGNDCNYIGCGTVYRLAHSGSNWIFSPLYDFQGSTDGGHPGSPVVIAPNGSLYSAAQNGSFGKGVVFNLKPSATACHSGSCSWVETVIHSFAGQPDGDSPSSGTVFDRDGNLYGTTYYGGAYGLGALYQLTPSNGGWTESILYSFTGGYDGWGPLSGVILDEVGNLYGVTNAGSDPDCDPPVGCGTAYQLTPSSSGWAITILHVFHGGADGGSALSLIFDRAGNLYGTANGGGTYGMGTAFKLTPSNGSWTFTVLYNFTQDQGYPSGPAMDSGGNLYGTVMHLNGGPASVFKLSPGPGGWTYTSLHDFGGADGSWPNGVTLDAIGDIYGTCFVGGGVWNSCFGWGCGTVWEITP